MMWTERSRYWQPPGYPRREKARRTCVPTCISIRADETGVVYDLVGDFKLDLN